jgi:hypothetical protein
VGAEVGTDPQEAQQRRRANQGGVPCSSHEQGFTVPRPSNGRQATQLQVNGRRDRFMHSRGLGTSQAAT